ncbi:SAM-dependent methyltransferase [Nocardiopsis ansamitocini]|uniref:Cyclopropane-fatty-acyl-phospholipid synthase n=1 Tax=Nocardiopsis ansamitocini TaxID=1670832 RepID=A0A9W6P6Q0_9ACTN|nr:cyclopropane-fatty-acyl-phospholipid synthase family protein [Nocardiopsis ansamitocini]GLU48008.1 cyclopropane-fatty-acyl-phospholipid synthase [Nocardiopsis ansamitocini]
MRLADMFERVVGPGSPIRLRAYDGSTAGDPDSDVTLVVRSPVALNYLAQSPGGLGLTRAYVSGHIDIEGDFSTALRAMADLVVKSGVSVGTGDLVRIAANLGWVKFVNRVPPPPQEVRRSKLSYLGLRHSRRRDAQAIHHHYDVSNAFYEMVLGSSMTYTCGVYPYQGATLEQAQFHKYGLVSRKLGLAEGMRLLDVGCGWGGMVMHAAREHRVKALGVTLSKEQAEWAQKRIAQEGLGDLAEVRHMDYRELPDAGYDCISSIGLTEHIGRRQVPGYFAALHAKLRPGGRLLNHCITRPRNDLPPIQPNGVINRYVFPDGELLGPGWLQTRMNDAGFEIRHQENLREHYALTLRDWAANLERNWDAAVREVGEGTARVWRLYIVGCVLGFELNAVQLHQMLGVKPDGADARMPLRPSFEPPAG